MIGAIILAAVAVGALSLGVRGIAAGSIPWSKQKDITGTPARVVGFCCLAFGLAAGLFALLMMVLIASRAAG